jgi:hypothetical protein
LLWCMIRFAVSRHEPWGHEAAELPFKKLGKRNRRAMLQVRSDDLHPNRQTCSGPIDPNGGCREAAGGCGIGPDEAPIARQPSTVNGTRHTLILDPRTTLLDVLREVEASLPMWRSCHLSSKF